MTEDGDSLPVSRSSEALIWLTSKREERKLGGAVGSLSVLRCVLMYGGAGQLDVFKVGIFVSRWPVRTPQKSWLRAGS